MIYKKKGRLESGFFYVRCVAWCTAMGIYFFI